MTHSIFISRRSDDSADHLLEDQTKAAIFPMSDDLRREVAAQLTDDVLAKLTSAFFEVIAKERWGKRDLALISGLNETAIGHILAGRRKNLTIETIALLARSMQKRPELILHDTRARGNRTLLSASASEQPVMLSNEYRLSTLPSSTAAAASQSLQQRPPATTVTEVLQRSEQSGLLQR
jgi:hypothetical protein